MSKINRETAIAEVEKFLRKHKSKLIRRNKLDLSKIEDEYLDMIEAVEDGNLVFDKNNNAVYKLLHPLKDQDDNIGLSEIEFRSRIKYFDTVEVLDGIDFQKQQGTFIVKNMSLATQQPVGLLKKMDDEDIDVINQVTSVLL